MSYLYSLVTFSMSFLSHFTYVQFVGKCIFHALRCSLFFTM